ncbi:hypothetical protein BO71DRAFT_411582 [Aspergillus ellipticus CBS 707.79]|uniref:Myb-like DNA-binding domain-containing protein n=1 Tax=Aspergillus ellipticus CBS 707.79 TaxID=1448320 RepID=A0A319D2P9_9EURO|nr:hypothetical protein BO71DRAFT_411582 [Aspergillus ellipticus CBS 707.79]
MPPKSGPDTTLLFLYVCLLKSDFSAVDYKAVAAATDLNINAARMRFSRLKKQLDAHFSEDGKVDVKRGESAAEGSAASTPSSTPVKKQLQLGNKNGKVNLKRPEDDDAAEAGPSAKKQKISKRKKVEVESDDDDTMDQKDHVPAPQEDDLVKEEEEE